MWDYSEKMDLERGIACVAIILYMNMHLKFKWKIFLNFYKHFAEVLE